MNILGVAFLDDASAAVVRDGELVSAVSEERLNRAKLWSGMPREAIQKALDLAGLTLRDIDIVATHGAAPPEPAIFPFLEKEKAIRDAALTEETRQTQLAILQKRLEHERKVLGSRTPARLAEIETFGRPVRVVGHHEAHAASAYYGSGWEHGLILTADGWGEDGSAAIWQGQHGKLARLAASHTFDSLGYFYGSITGALGFIPHRHEGKVLGLAAHCRSPRSYPLIRSMIDYDSSAKRFVGRMERGLYRPQFDNPALKTAVEQFSREDVAAAAQHSLEEVVLACVADLGGSDLRIGLAGGLFANVKLNQRIREMPNVADVFVFPNMGDGGLSIGAAWLVYAQETGRSPKSLRSMYCGPESGDRDIERALAGSGLRYARVPHIEERVADLLAQGHVVARFHGRMEFGPRALGHRSILFQAGDPTVNNWLNQRLNRSEFMPFAPATLAEHAADYYIGLDKGRAAARYMTMTFDCTARMRAEAPAAVHVDGTARPQVVSAEDHPDFHRILSAYHRLTGKTTVINTSFNMHEEPIVCTVEDAVRAFRDGRLPYLAAGEFLVEAEEGLLT